MPAILPFIPAIIGGVASVAGGALANRGSQSASTTPTAAPGYGPLQNQILDLVTKRLSTSPDLSGYQGTGITNIDQTYGMAKQASDNNLSARGLSTSPVAGAVDAKRDLSRAGDIASFRNSIPLLSRQLQDQDLNTAAGVLRGGMGSTSTGTVENGGGAAGAFTNLAAYLGYLQGKGAFPKGAGQGSAGINVGAPGMGGY